MAVQSISPFAASRRWPSHRYCSMAKGGHDKSFFFYWRTKLNGPPNISSCPKGRYYFSVPFLRTRYITPHTHYCLFTTSKNTGEGFGKAFFLPPIFLMFSLTGFSKGKPCYRSGSALYAMTRAFRLWRPRLFASDGEKRLTLNFIGA